jgi:hypothetical protein
VEIKKIIFYFGTMFLLTGCFHTSALVGPTFTLASTGGNIFQTGLSVTTDHAVKKETGKSTTEHISDIINENRKIKITDININ